jgi:DNA-binding SARP family transcriptional activator/tetratricopeptide (TPR) repeat protein
MPMPVVASSDAVEAPDTVVRARLLPGPEMRVLGVLMTLVGLLGEVIAESGGRPIELGPARQRCVLAALAVDAGRVVPVDRLADRVWAPDLPPRPRAILPSYLSRLRTALGVDIAARSGGYVLLDVTTDLARFRELVGQARGAEDDVAFARLTEALGCWRGEALSGLDSEWAQAERARLRLERSAAEVDLVDVRLRQGEGAALLAGLALLLAEHPLDERVAGQQLLALARAGRAADALEHYRVFRARLVAELGAEPRPELQELHKRVLAGDFGGAVPAAPAAPGAPAAPVVVPRQLPAAPMPFVGRVDELERLDAALTSFGGRADGEERPDAASTSPATVATPAAAVTAATHVTPAVAVAPIAPTSPVTVITGAGGIGKTWLALHWAHRFAARFPDGQLFVDLQGFSTQGPPMAPEVALRGFLAALGVEPAGVPADAAAQAVMFRELVANRTMLVVLDNAAEVAQVEPLLPGGSCTVLVTSRNRLGLDAAHVSLDVLARAESHDLLARRLGVDRVAAEPGAAEELCTSCGGFPLALSILTGHAHTRPNVPLTELAAELRALGLGALDSEDAIASLPTVLSLSVRALSAAQARMFVLLGIAPGPDISTEAAVGLAGPEAPELLRALEKASLVTVTGARYRMHDLIRQHAAAQDLGVAEREAALRRVVEHYLHTAFRGDQLLSPEREPVDLEPRAPEFADGPAALAWFDAEHACLLAAHELAVAKGWHTEVFQLAWSLNTFHYRRGLFRDEAAVWRRGLAAAEHAGAWRAQARRHLGRACGKLGRFEEATAHLEAAIELAEAEQDLLGMAYGHGNLAMLLSEQGEYRRSLDHVARVRELFQALGKPGREAQCLNNMAWLESQLGDYDAARGHGEASLVLHRETGFRVGEGYALDTLGHIELHSGRPRQAVERYRQALAVRRDLGDNYETANTLFDLGKAFVALGQRENAQEVWQEALDLYRAQQRAIEVQRVLEAMNEPQLTRG